MDDRSRLPQQETDLLKDYVPGQVPQLRGLWRWCLAKLLLLLLVGILGVGLFYGVIAITYPWSLRIGGRWTPFLSWRGYGRLITKDGREYPLYVDFTLSSHYSQLRLEGLLPTGGVDGNAWLCTPSGAPQRLDLSGTLYGGRRSTDGALMEVRLLEMYTAREQLLGASTRTGYFDLRGRWHGAELLMSDRGEYSEPLRSGLRIEGRFRNPGLGHLLGVQGAVFEGDNPLGETMNSSMDVADRSYAQRRIDQDVCG